MKSRQLLSAASLAAYVALVAACASAQSTQESAPTSTVSVTASPNAEPVTDVNAEDYATPNSPGYYRWTYSLTNGTRDCYIFPGNPGYSAGLGCFAPFPEDSPLVSNGPFNGPPNQVQLTDQGVAVSINEGGPPGAQPLPANHRITVGDYTCTALPDNGIACSGPDAGFTVQDDVVTQTGTTSPAVSPSETTTSSTTQTDGTNGPPMDQYTDGTTPVPPGTACGAATGRTVVVVVSGSISCTDALDIIEGYLSAPDDGQHGNARIMEYRGWQCSAPTYVMAVELGYSAKCTRGDIELIAPISG